MFLERAEIDVLNLVFLAQAHRTVAPRTVPVNVVSDSTDYSGMALKDLEVLFKDVSRDQGRSGAEKAERENAAAVVRKASAGTFADVEPLVSHFR